MAGRIATCLDKLDDDAVWTRDGENQNAVGNLVLHLCGNVRQWIGFGVAGQPDIRVRDREFQARGGVTRDELKDRLSAVVEDAAKTVESLEPGELLAKTKVQSYELTKLEAIYHVVEHFSQHTGQIIFAAKLATGEDLGFYRHLNPGKPAAHEEKTP